MLSWGVSKFSKRQRCCCSSAAGAVRRLHLHCSAAPRTCSTCAHLRARCALPRRAHRQIPPGRKMGAWGRPGQMCSDKFQLLVGAGCAHTCTSVFFIFSVTNKGLSTYSSILTASNLPMLQSRSHPPVFLVKTFLKEIQSLN